MKAVADGGNSHSPIYQRLVVRNPDTVHSSVVFSIPRVAIEPRGIIFFCFFLLTAHCSLPVDKKNYRCIPERLMESKDAIINLIDQEE